MRVWNGEQRMSNSRFNIQHSTFNIQRSTRSTLLVHTRSEAIKSIPSHSGLDLSCPPVDASADVDRVYAFLGQKPRCHCRACAVVADDSDDPIGGDLSQSQRQRP